MATTMAMGVGSGTVHVRAGGGMEAGSAGGRRGRGWVGCAGRTCRSAVGRAGVRKQAAAHARCTYEEVKVETLKGVALHDITPQVRGLVERLGVRQGTVTVLSRHTTTAVVINEMEGRLVDDTRQYLLRLAPPGFPYLHNDLHVRSGPPDWPGGDEAWRAQEPENAHSHLLSMLLGNSESVPVVDGQLALGTWQSLILVELDGPRTRTVGVQVVGHDD